MVSNKKLNHKYKNKEYITHKSHKNIEEISPYTFRTYLVNKCNDYNTILMLVNEYYPSTQTCSKCGYIRKGKEKLMKSKRIFICPKCDLEINRDINAAINIAKTQEYEIISA
jgi:putative transposase